MKQMPQKFDPENSKRPSEVRRMFGGISARYDLMNTLMTFGFDRSWRRHVVTAARLPLGGRLLDLGTGTGGIAVVEIRCLCPLTEGHAEGDGHRLVVQGFAQLGRSQLGNMLEGFGWGQALSSAPGIA